MFRDGAWEMLPLSDRCNNDGITATAVAISRDGKFIAGNQTVSREDDEVTGGAKLPCLWQLNEKSDEYELVAIYDDPRIANQGFWTTCMTDDGSIIAGLLTCGGGSSTIPAMFKDGKLVIWNELETRSLPYIYKDEIKGYFDYYFIDGHHDEYGNDFLGTFRSIDKDGRMYGYRTYVTDIVADAHGEGLDGGTLHVVGFVYDPATDTFTDGKEGEYYTAGFMSEAGNQVLFGNIGVLDGSKSSSLEAYFDVDSIRELGVIYSCDEAGRVFGGASRKLNELTGEIDEYPFVIVLEKGIASIEDLSAEESSEIDTIISLDGLTVAPTMSGSLKPGIYVIKNGKSTKKVLIR